MKTTTLFQPYDMQGIALANRFLMAPMTRSRASQPGDIPNDLMATYYGQRAGAGIIITEATQVSMQGMVNTNRGHHQHLIGAQQLPL